MDKIYFDYAATAPTDPEVIKAMEPYFFNKFGNVSSPHSIGREAQKALEESRETLAKFIGANSDEIVFNSGATEGNNHAVGGVVYASMDRGNHHLVISGKKSRLLTPNPVIHTPPVNKKKKITFPFNVIVPIDSAVSPHMRHNSFPIF